MNRTPASGGCRRSWGYLSLAVLLLAVAGAPAEAAQIIWQGSNGAASQKLIWSNTKNWLGSQLPVTGDDLIFNANSVPLPKTTTADDNIGALTVNTMSISSGMTVNIMSPSVLTVTSGVANTYSSNVIAGTLNVASGGTLNYTGGTAAGLNGSVSAGGVITNNGTMVLAGTWSNSGTITNTAGTTTLSGNWNNAGGTIRQNGGTLDIGAGSTITAGTMLGTITNGGTLNGTTIGGGGVVTAINLGAVAGGTLAGATVSGATGSGAITTLASTASTWSGGTNSGTLTAVANSTLNITGSLTNAGTISGGGAGSLVNAGTVTGGAITGTLANSSGTLAGVAIGNGSTATAVTGGTITGSSTLNRAAITSAANTGTLTAQGLSNTWTGGSNSGTIQTVAGSALTVAGLNNAGGVLSGGATGTLTLSSGYTVTGGELRGYVTSTGATLAGVQFNAVTLTSASPGTTLTGANTATGTNWLPNLTLTGGSHLNVTGGTTTLQNALSMGTTPSAATVDISGGGTVVMDSTSSLAGGGTFTVGSASLLHLYGNSGSMNGSIVFNGPGTVDSTAGVDPFASGAATVTNNGATLSPGGTGTAATWSFTNYTQLASGVLKLDVFGLGSTEHDLIVLTGPRGAGPSMVNIELVWGSAGVALNSGTPVLGSTISLMSAENGWTALPTVSSNLSPTTFHNGSLYWQLVTDSSGIYLKAAQYTAQQEPTPEPATVLLMGGALAALARFSRRRRA